MRFAILPVAAVLLAVGFVGGATYAGEKGVGTWQGPYLPAAIDNLDVSWWYNWQAGKDGCSGNGEFVPMIWGAKDVNGKELAEATNSGASAILTFNEPDNHQAGVGANMTVDQALDLWPQIQAAAKAHHMRIGSPAPGGKRGAGGWLDQFMRGARARGYEVDFICIHPYMSNPDPAQATEDLKRDLIAIHNYYKLPIWVTEYDMADWSKRGDPYQSPMKEAEFAKDSVRMMNNLPFVERYAWYVAMPDTSGMSEPSTCDASGRNTVVGEAYKNAR